jgi:hypothetical protein
MAKKDSPDEESLPEDPADIPPPQPQAQTIPILAKVGEIVFVRNSPSTVLPAIVVNDFSGQNAPGVVSLVVFMNDVFNVANPVKFIASAQHESDSIPDEVLINEPLVWWHGADESERILKVEAPAA